MIFDIGQWHINIFVNLYVDVEEEEELRTTTTTPTQHTIDLLFRPYRTDTYRGQLYTYRSEVIISVVGNFLEI